ncbi:putative plant self-incompatibility S1 [Rosa chinensis]|uniref:S-protein homolog n=1 Tax=Rosa chinensis TaxID=74649 RepID=A0A2P6Q1U8_ROSCH|nr:putative plant self-incompatibility S1 [Rosa chinensis]
MAALFSRRIILFKTVLLLMFLTMLKAKTHVRIINNLPDDMQLHIHCQSGDDDLGFHELSNLSSFEFSFKPNWIGSTRFFCFMAWLSNGHYFDIYEYRRDGTCLWTEHTCKWHVTPNGPCKEFSNGTARCYPWNT